MALPELAVLCYKIRYYSMKIPCHLFNHQPLHSLMVVYKTVPSAATTTCGIRRKEAKEWEMGLLFWENYKQLWTYSTQEEQSAYNAACSRWHSVAFLLGVSQKLPQIRRPLLSYNNWNYKTLTLEWLQALSFIFPGSQALLLFKEQVLKSLKISMWSFVSSWDEVIWGTSEAKAATQTSAWTHEFDSSDGEELPPLGVTAEHF